MKRVAGEDLLAILDTFGKPALQEVDDRPLVVRFGKARRASNQPRGQRQGVVELITADRQRHLAKRLIVLGGISPEPDGPERVFGHAAHHRIVVAQCFTQHRVAVLETPHDPQRQHGGATGVHNIRGREYPAQSSLVVSRHNTVAETGEIAVGYERLEVLNKERSAVRLRHGRHPHSPTG